MIIEHCVGDIKHEIVANNIVYPVTQLKLLSGQEKSGCCGKLKNNYFLFGYNPRDAKGKGGGSFYVGHDCAKQFVELINGRRKKAGIASGKPYRVLDLPPLFNPLVDHRAVYPVNTFQTNRELIDAIHLLATLWNTPIYGPLLYVLTSMLRHPERAVSEQSVLFVNTIIGKDRMIASGKCSTLIERLRYTQEAFGAFAFYSLADIVSAADPTAHNYFHER